MGFQMSARCLRDAKQSGSKPITATGHLMISIYLSWYIICRVHVAWGQTSAVGAKATRRWEISSRAAPAVPMMRKTSNCS